MQMIIEIIIGGILLGVALAMDAFSVSLANGLNNPKIKHSKMLEIAIVFAAFQTAMPLIGWFCVHALAERFVAFQPFIPWIAFILLGYIGGKMLYEGIKNDADAEGSGEVTLKVLAIQGIATSIDALSVGFTISDYDFVPALIESVLIGVVTFFICYVGVHLGRKLGMKLAGKASILGGVILIGIGIKILIDSFI